MHTMVVSSKLVVSCELVVGSELLVSSKRNSAAYTIPFVLFILEFPFEGIRNFLNRIPRNFAVLYSKYFAELNEIKSILYKIPYSVEFQKGTSENTLFGNFFHYPLSVL